MTGVTVPQPDVTLVLDNEGVITDATLANAIADEGVAGWLGRPWTETIGDAGGESVRRMIEDARTTGISAFGQVTQRFPSGRELPIEYATARVAGRPGLIAVGRNLQAVIEMQSRLQAARLASEQEYWKLREIETRYRHLFDASGDLVLIVRTDSLRVADTNLAATRELGLAPDTPLLNAIAPGDRPMLQAMLGRVQQHGRAPGVIARVGAARTPWMIRASLLTGDAGSAFQLQLAPAGLPAITGEPDMSLVAEVVERFPDAFVLLDQDGVIRWANGAFLDLTQTAVASAVIGRRMGDFLSVPGTDRNLLGFVQRFHAVRALPASLEGALGLSTPVEITAVGDREGVPRRVGVVLRDTTRRAPPDADLARANGLLPAMSARLGPVSMPEIVRETVETVERHLIMTALVRVDGNRSAAAELLGLSRQSLYVKLARYGLDATGREDT